MKKSGIAGYIRLLIAVIIIIIVAVTGGLHIKKILKDENVKNFESDLLLVQAKTELVKGNYIMDKENHPLKGIQITQLPEEINIQDIYDKGLITEEEREKYYVLNEDALNEMGLNGFSKKYEGKFIVNYDTYEVIYTKGYENENGLWCYKVSELNKVEKPINIDEFKEESEEAEEKPSEETSAEEKPVEETPTEEIPAEETKTEEQIVGETSQKDLNERYKRFKEDVRSALQTVKEKIAQEKQSEEVIEEVVNESDNT